MDLIGQDIRINVEDYDMLNNKEMASPKTNQPEQVAIGSVAKM